MNQLGLRCERALSIAVVSLFAACWFTAVVIEGPPEFPSQYASSAILVTMLAAPWVFAVRLLWRAWWKRCQSRLSAMDGPALLLEVSRALLPDARRDWGNAMAAELHHVDDSAARWWFALGCARTALLPQCRADRVLFAAIIVAGSIVAVGPAVNSVLPPLRVFAFVFCAIAGTISLFATARSGGIRPGRSSPFITCAGTIGVALCIAATALFLVENPAAAESFSPPRAATLAAMLAIALWISLAPPESLVANGAARGAGLCAGLTLGLGFLWTSRSTVHTYSGPLVWVLLAPAAVLFAASGSASMKSGSTRAGLQTAVWTAIFGSLLIFALWLPEAMRRYAVEGRLLSDGESGYAIGANLPDAIWSLFLIPTIGLPFGIFGAFAGRRLVRTRFSPPSAIEDSDHQKQHGEPAMMTLSLALAALLIHTGASGGMDVLPIPTGPHKVGRMSFHWKDETRDELETKAAGDKRELMVHLFYPADAAAKGERAIYVPDSDTMRGPFSEEQIERVKGMRAYAIDSARVPMGDAKFPVAVLMPGGGMKGLTYHVFLEDLPVTAGLWPPSIRPTTRAACVFPMDACSGTFRNRNEAGRKRASRRRNGVSTSSASATGRAT